MVESPPSDAALVPRARRGDASAFEALYRAHAGRVYGLCLRLTADPERAEELTQEAFVRVWERLRHFRGESGFATWLHRVAANLAVDDLRARGRWRARFVEEATAPETPAAGGDPAAGIDLERAVAGLPPQARAVFVLHDVEGYRHREIAELTGLAEGTSKTHLHRARRRLRKALRR